jgi:hypothetical protein
MYRTVTDEGYNFKTDFIHADNPARVTLLSMGM